MNPYIDDIPKELKKTIYDGFCTIQEIEGIDLRVQQGMLLALTGMLKEYGWPVIGITEAAAIRIQENEFKRPKKINRSHIYSRKETAEILFSKYWTFSDFWNFFLERDCCVLATSKENYSKEPEDLWRQVPKGLFQSAGFAFKVGKEEAGWLKEQL
jgi:hypothetical protein